VGSRAYTGHDDLVRMQELAAECWRLDAPYVTSHVGDLPWRMYQHPDKLAEVDVRLWLDGDECRAWGWRWLKNGDIDFLVHPEEADLLDELLAWAEDGSVWTLEARAEPLRARGYERHGETWYEHHVGALDALPAAAVPDGFVLRHVEPRDLERRVEAHRAAFAPSRVVAESYARLQEAAPYRYELDWIVEAPDGRCAAFALCWLDERNGVAELEPVGTHPDFRRRGLARAVSIAALRASDAPTGLVYSYGGSAATALYDGIGLRRLTRHLAFRRPGGKGTA
jgi:ribosomal protein S18 acetylase RimI-like enzyme